MAVISKHHLMTLAETLFCCSSVLSNSRICQLWKCLLTVPIFT